MTTEPLPVDPPLLAVFEALPDPAILIDPDGRIVHVNPAAERLFDREAGDPIGRAMWDVLMEPRDREEVRARFVRLVRGEETDPLEVEMSSGSGGRRAVNWKWTVLPGEAGAPGMLLATGTDVTELRELANRASRAERWEEEHEAREEALRESGARFSGIVELASDAIISVDREHRIRLFNSGAETIFGYRAEEVLGGPLDVLLPEGARATHADHIRSFDEAPVRARKMGQRREIAGRRKSGEEFPAEASILKVDVGGERLFTVLLRDVTDHRRREAGKAFLAEVGRVLAGSLELTETLRSVAALTVGHLGDVCIIDLVEKDGGVHRIESAEREGLDGDVAEGLRTIPLDRERPHLMYRALRLGESELVPLVTVEHVEELAQSPEHRAYLETLVGGAYMTVPLRARERTLGVLLCARVADSPAFDAEDLGLAEELGLRAALAVENARLYEAAQRAVRARDDVLAVVSHDLGNPLQAIFIGLEALERAERPGVPERAGRAEHYRKAIRHSAERMERLIRDLLEVRRMEAGHGRLKRSVQALGPLVEYALDGLEPLARAKEVEIRNEVPDAGLPPVAVDADRIQQVLSNLVGNALKHCDAGGRITLRAGTDGGELWLAVEDDGSGIPPEHLAHVFDRFWRLEDGRGIGAGLGLAICREIVRAHGGGIRAESEVGRGSVFTFTVPLRVDDEGSSEEGPGAAPDR